MRLQPSALRKPLSTKSAVPEAAQRLSGIAPFDGAGRLSTSTRSRLYGALTRSVGRECKLRELGLVADFRGAALGPGFARRALARDDSLRNVSSRPDHGLEPGQEPGPRAPERHRRWAGGSTLRELFCETPGSRVSREGRSPGMTKLPVDASIASRVTSAAVAALRQCRLARDLRGGPCA